MRLRFAACAALAGAASFVWAAEYFVRPVPLTKQAVVTIKQKPGTSATEFRMPAWAPGDYQIFNFGNRLSAVTFERGGKPVEAVRGADVNLWTILGGADSVTYTVSESRGNFSHNLRVTPSEMFISGPGVFGWFGGHQAEVHTVTLVDQPLDWKARSPLRMAGDRENSVRPSFQAPNYDVLLDSPIVAGSGLTELEAFGPEKRHDIVAFGRAAEFPTAKFVNVCDLAARESIKLFGGSIPYDRYKFLMDIGGFAAGLEHATSTRVGIWSPDPDQHAGLIFHEFFHAFNVKVIRPAVLGPFDYTKPAVTGSLWWLEGVTDYYASVLMTRAGFQTKAEFLQDFAQSYRSWQRNSNRLLVSADESSRRVWEGRGSQGYRISYYHKGRLIGFTLDLAIRFYSEGKHSLDDVCRALYDECRDGKPGFEEGRIRELCVKFGGNLVGSIYDTCVTSKDELPLSDIAQQCGLTWSGTDLTLADGIAGRAKAIQDAWPMR